MLRMVRTVGRRAVVVSEITVRLMHHQFGGNEQLLDFFVEALDLLAVLDDLVLEQVLGGIREIRRVEIRREAVQETVKRALKLLGRLIALLALLGERLEDDVIELLGNRRIMSRRRLDVSRASFRSA